MKKTIAILTIMATMLLLFQCKKSCIKSDRCNLEPESGPCMAAIGKYYYDKKTKECKQFSWGGCGGVVPFDTKEECEKQCDCK